jgi:hypothetical protein
MEQSECGSHGWSKLEKEFFTGYGASRNGVRTDRASRKKLLNRYGASRK